MAATAKSVKNVPKFVSLETKLHLERRGEPVIGLDQIEVIKPRTNPEMYEPKYRCTLCCVTAEIDPIYQHLVGAKHRTKYDILVHTFPDSEEEISARKFPIPTDSINSRKGNT